MIYEPAEDSFLLSGIAKKYASGKVLDMGTGSGVQIEELLAEKKIDSLTGADINTKAIAFCKKRIKDPKVNFISSNLFSKITQSFDTILFNPPYLPEDENDSSDISVVVSGGKKGHELIVQFIEELNGHLENEGVCLLLFSSLSNPPVIESVLEQNLFRFEKVAEKNLFFERLYVYKISKSVILKEISMVTQLRYLDKGKRGLVYTGIYKQKTKVAIKIKNPKSTAAITILKEALALKKVNKWKIGPKVILATEQYIMYTFVDGLRILDTFKILSKKDIKHNIKQILEQMHCLDSHHQEKGEMHHPTKHILIEKNHPVLIDFERMKYSERPRNFTQFCQFLTSGSFGAVARERNISIDIEKVRMIAKSHKNEKKDIKLVLECLQ